jgi:thioredoxin-related protein
MSPIPIEQKTKGTEVRFRYLFAVLLFVSLQSSAQQVSTLPDFTFYTLQDNTFTKFQIPKGRISLFMFFDVTCYHCQKAMQAFNAHYREFRKINLFFVSLDTKKGIEDFMMQYGKDLFCQPNALVLMDLNYSFMPKFQAEAYPSFYVFSAANKLISHTEGEVGSQEILSLAKNNFDILRGSN